MANQPEGTREVRATAPSADPRDDADAASPAMLRSDFTVVIPAFDEAPVIPALVSELRASFKRHGLDGEVILVDDGSGDGTAELAEREATGWARFRVVRHKRNRGKTEAMVTAAAAASEPYGGY